MKAPLKRVCIYPKDVERVTGKSYRQCVRILKKIRTVINKQKTDLVTINEFCDYFGLKPEDVEPFIFD